RRFGCPAGGRPPAWLPRRAHLWGRFPTEGRLAGRGLGSVLAVPPYAHRVHPVPGPGGLERLNVDARLGLDAGLDHRCGEGEPQHLGFLLVLGDCEDPVALVYGHTSPLPERSGPVGPGAGLGEPLDRPGPRMGGNYPRYPQPLGPKHCWPGSSLAGQPQPRGSSITTPRWPGCKPRGSESTAAETFMTRGDGR